MREADVQAVLDALRSGWLTMGPRIAAFEQEFAAYIGAPLAVAVSSGTSALHLAVRAVVGGVEGSQAAIQALRPALQKRDATLVTTLDTNFKAVFAAVDKYRTAGGFKPYNLSDAEKKQLGTVVDALAEPVSKVAGVIAKK